VLNAKRHAQKHEGRKKPAQRRNRIQQKQQQRQENRAVLTPTTEQEIKGIIDRAKEGNEQAKNKLVELLKQDQYMRALSRYLHLNRLLEPDDVKSEFWIGVVLALPKCNPDLGDPLHFLSWSGINRVKGQLRKKITRGVVMKCIDCGYTGNINKNKRTHTYECPTCKGTNIETWQREVTGTDKIIANMIDIRISSTKEQQNIDISIIPQELNLSPQSTHVFEFITSGVDRDNYPNYLKEIAKRMEISPQCVSIYLNKIRKKLREYLKGIKERTT